MSANYAFMGMWRDSLRRILLIGFYFVHIRGAGPMPGPARRLGDGQTESYPKDMSMTGLASAWAMARGRSKDYRRKVDAASRCSGVCPPYLTNMSTWHHAKLQRETLNHTQLHTNLQCCSITQNHRIHIDTQSISHTIRQCVIITQCDQLSHNYTA